MEFDNKTLDLRGSGDPKEFINEFNAWKPLPQTSGKSRSVVIPALEDEWLPLKRMTLGQSDEFDLKFETASVLDQPDDSKMSYDLIVRSAGELKSGEDPPRSACFEDLLVEKFKADLQRLPEDRGFEDFEEVPVESFAVALMESYGWRKGRGIGKNAKEDVKIKEYSSRTGKQGLGFVSDVFVGLPKRD